MIVDLNAQIYEDLTRYTCGDCKGFPLLKYDSDCQDKCEVFRIAVAIEVLGLSEYWDGIGHYQSKYETVICEFIEKLAKAKIKLEGK